MTATTKIVLVAVAGAVLGGGIGLWLNGPGPILRSEVGQRAIQTVLSANAPPAPGGLAIARRGDPVPSLQLPRLDGSDARMPADFAGRPLLVNFWASWCGPCIEEMPELNRFASAQGSGGTQVVGIALDDADAVRAFLKQVPVHYPILLDQAGPADSSVQLGNPRGVLPYSVLVSADGHLLKQKVGPFQPGEIDDWAH